MTQPLDLRLAGPDDLPAVLALRHEVFVIGQGVPVALERDGLDDVCDHAVAALGCQVVGTGRLLPPELPGGAAVVGRMAVRQDQRGRGVGAAVLAVLEERARGLGRPVVELHAQVHAQRFYERAGYAPVGPVYPEAGIDHVTMRKSL